MQKAEMFMMDPQQNVPDIDFFKPSKNLYVVQVVNRQLVAAFKHDLCIRTI